tara:strand:- start:840 stop:1205 length:366 start_codon:yes stop_codon:yes gene_type:complete
LGDLTKNFSKHEFACKCGCGQENMHYGFVLALQRVRNNVTGKIKINSGFRCRKHNASKKVGGKPTSSHLKGIAVDIACKGSKKRHELLFLLGHEFNRIGIGKDFIHVDSDHVKANNVIWVY